MWEYRTISFEVYPNARFSEKSIFGILDFPVLFVLITSGAHSAQVTWKWCQRVTWQIWAPQVLYALKTDTPKMAIFTFTGKTLTKLADFFENHILSSEHFYTNKHQLNIFVDYMLDKNVILSVGGVSGKIWKNIFFGPRSARKI